MKINGQFVDLDRSEIYPAEVVVENGVSELKAGKADIINSFVQNFVSPEQLEIHVGTETVKVIGATDGSLLTDELLDEVGEAYAELTRFARSLGSCLKAPYMTMSFMSLLVIPSLKLSDLGLFDGNKFSFTEIECR
ncbi:MAG: hypothetical protein KBT44_06540 [Bacteroidales bacterium]|nr:hypothetical protein [Candidatus Equibacterium intestinale]